MTANQLKEYGVPMNQWTDLNGFKKLLFTNEASLYPATTEMFYFDSTDELLFVRHILPENLFILKIVSTNVIEENGKKQYVVAGGHKDSKIGWYHDIYDLDAISAVK